MSSFYKKNSQYYNSFQEKKINVLFQKRKVVLPKEYKEFILKYKVGRSLEKWDGVLDSYFRPFTLHKVTIQVDSDSLSYNWLSSIGQILWDLEFNPSALEMLNSMQLLLIGNLADREDLFLGVGEENHGMIYRYFYDTDEAPKLLFTSIFEFVNSINFELKDEFKDVKSSTEKRYSKNDSVDFEKSQVLDNIEKTEYESDKLISSETLLNSLNMEIDEVRS